MPPTQVKPIDLLSPEARAHLEAGGVLRNGQIPEGANVVTGAMLEPQTALSVPSAPQGQDFASTIAGIPTIESLVSKAQEPTQAETQQKTIQQRLLSALQKISGKETVQLEAEEIAGVPALEKQVVDINAQIKALQAESAAIPLQIQQESIARGRTAGGVAPLETARLRDTAIKALGLSAISSALQGNLLAAQTQGDRVVKMKFADAENQIEFLRTAFQINKDILERTDKKRADNLKIILAERDRLLKDQKENTDLGLKMAMKAISNNPENEEARMAAQSVFDLDSSDELYLEKAFSFVGKYQTDPNETRESLLNLKIKQAQLNKLDLEAKKTLAEINNAQSTGGISTYQRERAVRNIQSISELRGRVTGFTVGAGSLLSWLPGTTATDFSADVDTLKANIAFGELTAMREASKTGGALGQISDKEAQLLQSALGALNTRQSKESFVKNLNKIEESINRWYRAAGENPPEVPIDGVINDSYRDFRSQLLPDEILIDRNGTAMAVTKDELRPGDLEL